MKQTEIKKRFLTIIYKDLILAICALTLLIFVPSLLSTTFTPNLIIEVGYGIAWIYWMIGITFSILVISLIYGGIYEWFSLRWNKAKKEVEKNGRY